MIQKPFLLKGPTYQKHGGFTWFNRVWNSFKHTSNYTFSVAPLAGWSGSMPQMQVIFQSGRSGGGGDFWEVLQVIRKWDIYIAILVGGCTAGICPIETDSASSFFLKLSFFFLIVQFPWFEIWRKVADTFPVQPIYVKFLAVNIRCKWRFQKSEPPLFFHLLMIAQSNRVFQLFGSLMIIWCW